jgi:hypothetical protein
MSSPIDMADAIRAALTDRVVADFSQNGFVVLDRCLPDALARAYLADIKKARKEGLMAPNKVQFATSQGPIVVVKPNVYEADMHQAQVRARLHTFDSLFSGGVRDIAATANKAWPELELNVHDDAASQAKEITIKLQVNEVVASRGTTTTRRIPTSAA